VAVELADRLDVGRGDVLVAAHAPVTPTPTTMIEADVSWFVDRPLTVGSTWVAKHGTRHARATVASIEHALDIDTMRTRPADALALNALGRVRLVLNAPIVVDRYDEHRDGGRLVLVDEATNLTAGALMVRSAAA
jgi:sulfate adenylyltransferase subunit 1 (EFTu-like GTPase family)